MKQVSLLVEDYHYEKLKDMAWKRRISMCELFRDMIDELGNKENNKDIDIIKTGLKVISNMLQGRLDGNFHTMSDEKILESVDDLIKYMEG